MGFWLRLLSLVALVAVYATVNASPALADGPRDREARQIAESLACPICEGQSVAESNSQLAQQMRDVIRKRVDQGESRDSILAYFVERYGEGVLLAPPKSGFNQILWWLPTLGLLLGAGVAALMLRHWKASRRASGSSAPNIKDLTGEELARYEQRLKEELGPNS